MCLMLSVGNGARRVRAAWSTNEQARSVVFGRNGELVTQHLTVERKKLHLNFLSLR
jgi:hypothetical protein